MEKIYKNALILETLVRLNKDERQKAVQELLKTYSLRSLAKETNIPYTTLYAWKTNNEAYEKKKGEISLKNILIKIQKINTNEFNDWGRLEQIKEAIELLLKNRK